MRLTDKILQQKYSLQINGKKPEKVLLNSEAFEELKDELKNELKYKTKTGKYEVFGLTLELTSDVKNELEVK